MDVFVYVLDLRHLYGLLHLLDHWYLHMLLDGHFLNLINDLHLRNIYELLNDGYLGHMPVLRHGHVDMGVHVFDLGYLHGSLLLRDLWYMPLLHDWNFDNIVHELYLRHFYVLMNDLVDGHLLSHHLGHLSNLLLNDRLLTLNNLP